MSCGETLLARKHLFMLHLSLFSSLLYLWCRRNPLGYGESLSLQRGQGVASGASDWNFVLSVPSLKPLYAPCAGRDLAAAAAAEAEAEAGSSGPRGRPQGLDALAHPLLDSALYNFALGENLCRRSNPLF